VLPTLDLAGHVADGRVDRRGAGVWSDHEKRPPPGPGEPWKAGAGAEAWLSDVAGRLVPRGRAFSVYATRWLDSFGTILISSV
jgi:hypothetical protein